MEMNASTPTLEVRKGEALLCQFRIDMNKTSVQNNVMEIGDLRCTADTLAGSVNADKVSG